MSERLIIIEKNISLHPQEILFTTSDFSESKQMFQLVV